MHGLTGGEHPRPLAARTVGKGFVLGHAQLQQIRGPRAAGLPIHPEAHPDAATDPLVQFAEESLDGHQPKTPLPALEVATKFTDASLKLVEILPGHARLAAVAWKHEAEELDPVGAPDAALLLVDDELEFTRQVSPDGLVDTPGGFPRLGEHEEVVRITHEAEAASNSHTEP